VVTFATALEIITGVQSSKAIAPDQLKLANSDIVLQSQIFS
jgi:hypothetical protein